jgi:hypothetical protein
MAYVSYSGGKPPIMLAEDGDGNRVGQTIGNTQQGLVQMIEIRAAAIARVILVGQEAGLLRLCIERSSGDRRGKSREKTAVAGRELDSLLRLKAPLPAKEKAPGTTSRSSDQPKSSETGFSIASEHPHGHS